MERENKILPDPPDETFTIRCPRLGHQINYSYCRHENNGLPCFKTLDCWYLYFDVRACLENQLSPVTFQTVFQRKAPPKVLSLLELIEQAKLNNKGID